MDFKFAVNSILKEEITKIGPTLTVPGFRGDKREIRELRRQLSEMLDAIGEKSTIVQGLNKTITTAEKLENATDQVVYLLKDASGNHGKGELIGLLKVGIKSLYLADPILDKVKQVHTLCILDFYVIETRQRSGYGKYLFDYMLDDQKINPTKLAIDAPSPKLIAFMEKHYGVSDMVKQMNNYAIGPHFFGDAELERDNQPDHGNSNYRPSSRNSSGHSTPSMSQLSYGRFAAPRPACSIASVIHGEVVPESANARY